MKRLPASNVFRILIVALCVFAPASRGSFAWAQSYEGRRIVAVDVKGSKTVAKETVLARIQTKPGAPYEEAAVSEDIRRLFALGFFTDVRAEAEDASGGLTLVFVVREKPAVGEVEFQGQRFLQKAKLQDLLGITKGELYDPRKVKQGIELIKAEYARKGFSEVEIVSRVEPEPAGNAVRLFLAVDEGTRLRIASILVEGNQAFTDKKIRRIMKTKHKRWFRPGVYTEQTLEEDMERIRAFYRKQGYQDVEVRKDIYRDPSGRGLYVHVKLSEGLQHRTGDVAIAGAVLFPEPEIRRVLKMKPGSVYSQEALQEDLRLIKQYYGDRGYIHADITPDPQLDAANKRVNLTYHIVENELVYVNRVDVRGNLSTRDEVIRRELRINPGQRFDGGKIRKSIDRLYNLGYFEEVTVDTEPTSDGAKDKEDLVVEVKEAKTGSFSFGGGFSSVDRLVGLVELEQRNFDLFNVPRFTGAGQDLRLRAEVGTVRRYFDLSFTEPWIFGRPVSFGIDGYNRTRLRSRNLGLAFEEERRGGGLRLGKEFADLVHLGFNYQIYRTDISDVVSEASADLKAEEGVNTVSVGGLSLALDDRDNRFDPAKGYYAFTSVDLAGGIFAADKDFYRLQAGANHYWAHGSRFVLESSVRGGVVNEYGDTSDVPIFERFFGGGSGTIRGFRERRVGPTDPASNDPIGGEALFVCSVEEVATLVKDERGRAILKGSCFYDVGNVWRRVGDFGESFKSGIGVGARVTTPIGPVRLDLGYPLTDLQGEKRSPRLHFNISRSF